MQAYQTEFIEFALHHKALCFGDYILKSGGKSAYFFNAGNFRDGQALVKLAKFYALAIEKNFLNQFDLIFGPAYKGIPLATCAALGLQTHFQLNFPVSFNRKEKKDHGEKGVIIGSELKGKRILLVDDVITAGITLRESLELIENLGGKLAGVMIALDRQEASNTANETAIEELQRSTQTKIVSIINRQHLIEFLKLNHNNKAYTEILKFLPKLELTDYSSIITSPFLKNAAT